MHNLATLFLGEYEYGDLDLKGGGVSDETVKFGYGFCATRTSEWFHCKLQIRPLVREGALLEKQIKSLSNIRKLKLLMRTKVVPDTKTNWPTGRRSQN
jgi:hypothetical protein